MLVLLAFSACAGSAGGGVAAPGALPAAAAAAPSPRAKVAIDRRPATLDCPNADYDKASLRDAPAARALVERAATAVIADQIEQARRERAGADSWCVVSSIDGITAPAGVAVVRSDREPEHWSISNPCQALRVSLVFDGWNHCTYRPENRKVATVAIITSRFQKKDGKWLPAERPAIYTWAAFYTPERDITVALWLETEI